MRKESIRLESQTESRVVQQSEMLPYLGCYRRNEKRVAAHEFKSLRYKNNSIAS